MTDWANKNNLRKEDIVEVFGFTCIPDKTLRKVHYDRENGELYILCTEGHHYIAGQLDEHNEYVGMKRKHII